MRYVLALISAALVIPAVQLYREDQAGRVPALQFVAKYDVETRRPDVAHTVGYAPSPDWAAEMVADAALRDAYEPVNLLDVPPNVRAAWIASAAHVDDELRFARDALLDAIAARPGWPFYQSLLGQTVFAIESRTYSPDLVQKSEGWRVPLLNAAHRAPAASSAWRSLAAAYLQTWPVLGNANNATAEEVFEHAFADPEFVRVAFPDAARLLGSDRAIGYVPDSPASLLAAFRYFAKRNDTAHAWPLHQRWNRAEWAARVEDLGEIDRHARRGDSDDVRTLCDAWTSRHSVWDFDSPAAHAQAARVLELWPGGRRGRWSDDPMAEVARYLMTRNGDSDHYAPIVARQIDSFAGVPPATVAEVKLLAGDVSAAERLAQTAEDQGSLEWAPYLLTLARVSANPDEALARLPPAAMETHEALLIRGKTIEEDGGSATVCSPKSEIAVFGAAARRVVHLHLTANQPAIVDVGVNRARGATLLVDRPVDVAFTLIGPRDKIIWMRSLCGGQTCSNVGSDL